MKVATFCYGSYMDPDVLSRFGASPDTPTPARLGGHRLAFTPHANVLPAPGETVHGFLYHVAHEDLDRLYGPTGYVTTYLPVPVLVETAAGAVPALTFVEEAPESPPDAAYTQAFLSICHRMGLPAGYVARVARAAGVTAGSVATGPSA